MSDTQTYVRLSDVESVLGRPLSDDVERFTLHEGEETNEAGIAELRDAAGLNVEPDGRRWVNVG